MSNSLEKKFTALCDWVRTNGGFVSDKIQLGGSSENRFIYSTSEINQNEKLIEIPAKCCISKDVLNQIPNVNTIDLANLNEKGLIVVALLHNIKLGKESFFYPYIKLLPKYHDYAYHPAFSFDSKAKERYASMSPAFAQSIEAVVTDIQKIFDILNKPNAVFTEDDVVYENIQLCYLVALTRQWNQGLVPVADLFQHRNESNMALGPNNTLITQSPLKSGEIIYDSYGRRSDMHMLAIYGFIDDFDNDNKQRVFDVALNMIEPKDNFNVLKNTQILKFIDTHKVFLLTNVGIQNDLLFLLRLATLSEKDFRFIDYNIPYYEKIISMDNECAALKNLLTIVKQHSDKITDAEIKTCENILTSGLQNTIEYKLAKAVMIQKTIFNETVKYALVSWNTLLGSPFKYDLKLN